MWINQTATFTCATNVTGYTLSFSIPAGIAHDTTVTDLPGGGQLATCSFIVTSDSNGTSARCLATNNGGLPVVSDPAGFAYGQGMEYICSHSFISLPCHNTRSPIISSRSYSSTTCTGVCIFISWKPPYVSPGLSVSYRVYINGEMNISTTNHTYYPTVTSSTIYNISVVAYNESVGDGPPADTWPTLIFVSYYVPSCMLYLLSLHCSYRCTWYSTS